MLKKLKRSQEMAKAWARLTWSQILESIVRDRVMVMEGFGEDKRGAGG